MKGRNQLAAEWSFPEPRRRALSLSFLLEASVVARETARHLHPASFALVMAAGSLAVATEVLGLPYLANAFFWFGLATCCLLCLLTLARLCQHPGDFFSDLFDNVKGPAYFTAVAATGAIGNQFIVVANNRQAGMVWWIVALFLWMCLAYAGFGSQTIKRIESDGAEGTDGGWGIAIAAAQSIATPSAFLAFSLSGERQEMLAFALAIAVGATALYGFLIAAVLYRHSLSQVSPADLLKGLFWATGTWWLPVRAIFGLSGQLYRRFPLTNPLYWGAVFALTFYTVGVYRLAEIVQLPLLALAARLFLLVALLAWSAALFGFIRGTVWKLLAAATPARDASNGHIAPQSGNAL